MQPGRLSGREEHQFALKALRNGHAKARAIHVRRDIKSATKVLLSLLE